MTRAKHPLLGLAVLLTLTSSAPSSGQLTSSIDRLEVSIWPEYDRPEALVILKAWLPEDAYLPRYVALPMPDGATINAVAKRDSNGQLLLAAHTIIESTGGREVRIAADVREVRLEYYAPIALAGDSRSYTFSWPGLVAFEAATFEIQQPIGATDLAVTPSPTSQATGFDGLTYVSGDLGSRSVGESFTLDLSYTKGSGQLTLTAIQPPPPGVEALTADPPPSPRPAEVAIPSESGSFPWLIVLPIVLIAALIVVWFLQSGSDS